MTRIERPGREPHPGHRQRPPGSRTGHPRAALAAATASLVAVFAASGAPIPLYERYRAIDGLTTSDLSIATVAYFVAVMSTLVFLGRLSDHLGRRPVSVAALVLAAGGCLVLTEMHGLGVLVLGRLLHGLACGLASSALTTYIVDLAPARPRWIGPAASAGAPLVGLTLGAVGSGALAEYGPLPTVLPYLIAVSMVSGCVAALFWTPEPVRRHRGALQSTRPRVGVPGQVRPLLPAASAVFAGTWALGGFYQAFSPTISATSLQSGSSLVAGVVFASYMAPYPIGSALTGRLRPLNAQRLGMAAFAVGTVTIVVGLYRGSTLTVVVAGIVAGLGQGAAFTGTTREMLSRTAVPDRAGLMSTVYLVSYGGAAVPNLVAGRASAHLSLDQVAVGYGALAVACALLVLASSARARHQIHRAPRPGPG